jgi:tRNA A-37 threonylcarbamoyl transferase component Bud32
VSDAQPEIAIGRVLAGKYRVERLLGAGGMGTVVAATHLGLGRTVALKFMRAGVLDDGEALGRFMREARAAAALRSEHVAQVMDVEVDTADGAPYIVMEYLEGQDLAALLETRGPPAVAEAVGYVLQACEGVAEAHARGIVHRDLKPANLFLTRRPDGTPLVKVLDFGVSKLSEAAQSGSFKLTHPRRTIGSPHYMSPEQMISSTQVDARADIWALGVILYELLAGQPPFAAANFVELGLEVTNRAHPSLAERVPGLAPGLVAIADRCLQKTPATRFANLAALGEALAPHAGPGGPLAARRIAGTLGILTATAGEPTLVTRTPRGRRPAIITVIAGGVAVVATIAAGGLWRRAHSERTPAIAASAPAPVLPPVAPPPVAPLPSAAPPAPAPRVKVAASPRSRRHVAERKPEARPAPAAPALQGATQTRRGPVVTDL